MKRRSFCEWIPILPWPVWPLAWQRVLGQNTGVGSMTLLLAMRGNIVTRSMSGPPFALQLHCTTVWCRGTGEYSMDINELIGERISQARTRHGWNQSELARRLGKPRQHLSQIEQGKQQPRAELLVELATALGASTDYLLGRVHDESQPAAQDATLPQPPALRRRPRTAASVD